MSGAVIWISAVSFVFAAVATGMMRRYALQANLLDVPNSRSSHSSPTPRGGGAAIVLAFFAGLLSLFIFERFDARVMLALLCGGGSMAIIGFLDDRRALRASVRFTVHVAAAMIAVWLVGGVSEHALADWDLHGAILGMVLAVLALIWMSNLFNFMDGIDGIAASETIFIAAAGALINWRCGGDGGLTASMLVLAAATLGFLVWNWPPARIFMGDIGSGFLGFTLAVLGLAASRRGGTPVESWVILSGIFLVDATVTLVRRVLRGERWFEAHRMHAYQKLASRWQGHLPVTVLVIAINSIWLFPWACVTAAYPSHEMSCVAAALLPLVVLFIWIGAGSRSRP
jgi:Fuc2NAc and GlcNAc transferase